MMDTGQGEPRNDYETPRVAAMNKKKIEVVVDILIDLTYDLKARRGKNLEEYIQRLENLR